MKYWRRFVAWWHRHDMEHKIKVLLVAAGVILMLQGYLQLQDEVILNRQGTICLYGNIVEHRENSYLANKLLVEAHGLELKVKPHNIPPAVHDVDLTEECERFLPDEIKNAVENISSSKKED